jgi:hypothetical protein
VEAIGMSRFPEAEAIFEVNIAGWKRPPGLKALGLSPWF